MRAEHASIVEAFLQQCARTPDRICVTFEGHTFTYGQLQRSVAGFATMLIARGVQRGDRLAMFMSNSPDLMVAYLGIHLAGAIVVPINTQYRQTELQHMFGDAGVRLCVTDAALRPELERLRDDLPALQEILVGDWAAAPAEGMTVQSSFDLPHRGDTAVIAYTSGTTGRSKGAMLSHGNQIANILAVCAAWEWTAADHLLLTLPLFHVHGLMVGVHGTLVTGARLTLRRTFEAADVYTCLLTEPITLFFGVPTMYTRLLAEAERRTEQRRPLRLYVSGSAPLSPHTFAEFERVFGQRIVERYGMTETLMNLTNPYNGERRPGTVGMPFPGQEARIVDVRTRQPVSSMTDGEIEVRGPHVCQGYWQHPEATAASFTSDGWFRTGDLGRVSDDGYYTITGRAKELIITGGYNVYPREIEDVLVQCPGVADVAVVGLPHADLGEQVAAAVVRTDPALTPETLITWCRDQLASYKKPRHIIFVDALPRNAMGKVQKQIVSDWM